MKLTIDDCTTKLCNQLVQPIVARDKVGVLPFVLKDYTTEEVDRLVAVVRRLSAARA